MTTPASGQDQVSPQYKFRNILIHASDEWLADGTKKYRKVFDRYETTFMRVEFSLFNKRFDEEDWEASIRTKCFFINGSQKNELSNLEEKRKITKEENIVFIRHSWGNATPGQYWRKGNYVWEGYVDDVKVGEAIFYIEDLGEAPPGENRYFDIESVRFFEGESGGATMPEKKYVRSFSQKDTRFVFGEFNIRNKTTSDYYLEIIFRFCDADGMLKGSHPYLIYVKPNSAGEVYPLYASWGNQNPGTWFKDSYTLEVIFLDQLIATIPFEVGDVFGEGEVEVITDMEQMIRHAAGGEGGTKAKTNEEILKESLEELNALTGLAKIKTEVHEMVQLVKYYQEIGKDVLHTFSLHSVFVGNPGTGKTTVARLLSRIYQGLGILEKGHLTEVDREGLVAGYVGQTAIKTAEKVNEAMGGILFIDEAYSLAQERGSPYDFGGEAIQVILKRMEDHRGKFGVIVAGYTQNMQSFINSNPGLKSRFDKYFVFEDYTPDELFVIALSMFRKEEVMPDVEAATHLKQYFTFQFERRDKQFGNARMVRQIVAEAVKNQHLRLAIMKKEERTADMMATILLADVSEFELKDTDFGNRRIGFSMDRD